MQQAVLRSDRVTLRPWHEDAVGFVLSVASDPSIPLIIEVPTDADIDGALAFIAAQVARWQAGHGWAWAITSRTGTAGMRRSAVDRPGSGPSFGRLLDPWVEQAKRLHL